MKTLALFIAILTVGCVVSFPELGMPEKGALVALEGGFNTTGSDSLPRREVFINPVFVKDNGVTHTQGIRLDDVNLLAQLPPGKHTLQSVAFHHGTEKNWSKPHVVSAALLPTPLNRMGVEVRIGEVLYLGNLEIEGEIGGADHQVSVKQATLKNDPQREIAVWKGLLRHKSMATSPWRNKIEARLKELGGL